MKTSTLALALALTFAFIQTPAAAGLSNQTKCDSGKLLAAAKFSQCRIKVDFIALKKGDKLSAEKKAAMEDKCDAKINAAFVALEGKYPDVGEDRCSAYGDAANMIAGLVAVSDAVADGSVSTDGSGALATLNDQEICEAAGGTWDSGACTPADAADRDCFREGACGVDGDNYGDFAGVDLYNSGCDSAVHSDSTYDYGVFFYELSISLNGYFNSSICDE